MQSILESQIRASREILSEHENINNDSIIGELHTFINLNELVKLKFDLKENVLSEKYEKFVKLMQSHLCKTSIVSLPVSFSQKELVDENEKGFNEYLINDLLTKYVKSVIELSRQDKSGKCHLNLYKPSKILLELFNCGRIYENFYLTPAFKRTVTTVYKSDIFKFKSKLSFDFDEDNEEKEEENRLG